MTIYDLVEISLDRAKRWHGGNIEKWSALEWAGGMAGEAGEACNAAKKRRRLELGLSSVNQADRHYPNTGSAKQAVAVEAVDTLLYACLLMARVGLRGYDVERLI